MDLRSFFCHFVVANDHQTNLQGLKPYENAFGLGLPRRNRPSLLEMSQVIQVASSTYSSHGIQQRALQDA